MAADIQLRKDIRELKSQLGGSAEVNVVGRRAQLPIDVSRTLRVSSLDRTDDYVWGRDFWNFEDLPDNQNELYWDDADSATSVVIRVVNMNNEFRYFTPEVMDAFIDTDRSTVTNDTTNQQLVF